MQLIQLKRTQLRTVTIAALFAAAERMDVYRHRLDRGGVKTALPGRHDAGAAVADGVDQRRLIGTIEPDLVGQVRRADVRIALAVVAVTGRAVLRKDFRAIRRVISGVCGKTR